MTGFSFTSLNVVVCRHDTYTKCSTDRWLTYLLGSIYFDKFSLVTVESDKFYFANFFMTSALVEKLACALVEKLA